MLLASSLPLPLPVVAAWYILYAPMHNGLVWLQDWHPQGQAPTTMPMQNGKCNQCTHPQLPIAQACTTYRDLPQEPITLPSWYFYPVLLLAVRQPHGAATIFLHSATFASPLILELPLLLEGSTTAS